MAQLALTYYGLFLTMAPFWQPDVWFFWVAVVFSFGIFCALATTDKIPIVDVALIVGASLVASFWVWVHGVLEVTHAFEGLVVAVRDVLGGHLFYSVSFLLLLVFFLPLFALRCVGRLGQRSISVFHRVFCHVVLLLVVLKWLHSVWFLPLVVECLPVSDVTVTFVYGSHLFLSMASAFSVLVVAAFITRRFGFQNGSGTRI